MMNSHFAKHHYHHHGTDGTSEESATQYVGQGNSLTEQADHDHCRSSQKYEDNEEKEQQGEGKTKKYGEKRTIFFFLL